MKRWKMRSVVTCPSCHSEDEDKAHMMKCQHPTAEKQWEMSLTALENWLLKSETEPMIRTTILAR